MDDMIWMQRMAPESEAALAWERRRGRTVRRVVIAWLAFAGVLIFIVSRGQPPAPPESQYAAMIEAIEAQ